MGRFRDRTGEVVDKLTVQGRGDGPKPYVWWRCDCACGARNVLIRADALGKDARSCGCGAVANRAALRQRQTRHGQTVGAATPEYRAWQHMRERCTDPTHPGYANYGGRGIVVCASWAESFDAFWRDMGARPSPDHSIERRDNDGPYSADNCYWATRPEQNLNRRTTRRLTHEGVTRCLAGWAREVGVHPSTLHRQLKRQTLAEVLQSFGRTTH